MLHSFLAVFALGPEVLGLSIIVATFAFAGTVAISGMYFKHQQRRAWADLARLALEKGQPVPVPADRDWDDAEGRTRKDKPVRQGSDVRRGLIMLAIGAGMFATIRQSDHADSGWYTFAYVPAFIGVALLLNALLESVIARRARPANDASSHS